MSCPAGVCGLTTLLSMKVTKFLSMLQNSCTAPEEGDSLRPIKHVGCSQVTVD
jgi:hypothetical protein